MTTTNITNDAQLRTIFLTMDAHQAQEIRAAYYDAIVGLRTLADALEIADAQQTEFPGPLLDEQIFAIAALDAMKHSSMGAIL